MDETQLKAYKEGTDYQFVESLQLGPWTSYSFLNDPKHACFVLSRYKFVSKILEDKKRILEIGCGDGFGIPIVAQGKHLTLGIDVDDRLITGDIKRLEKFPNIQFKKHDICEREVAGSFDGIFSIDVIEHLNPSLENAFMDNSVASLSQHGIYIIGTPNVYASTYATHRSKVQHINLKSKDSLKSLMSRYFYNVLVFSMNDEVIHTGFDKMAHYVFGVGFGKMTNDEKTDDEDESI